MESINNAAFSLQVSDKGCVDKLMINADSERMNWVLDPAYIAEVGYQDEDKLFGHFSINVNGTLYSSSRPDSPGCLRLSRGVLMLVHPFDGFEVHLTYDLDTNDHALHWKIAVHNTSGEELTLHDFNVWASLAYIMYRDADVHRNISQSCAVFPSLSPDFSKLACVRRSNRGPHLGVYAAKGRTQSVGTYCRFENNFFHNVSPSLDGILYHTLVLVGSGTQNPSYTASDWIYMHNVEPVRLAAGKLLEWEYVLMPYQHPQEFYEHAYKLGHPVIDYTPAVVTGGMFQAALRLPEGRQPVEVWLEHVEAGRRKRSDVTHLLRPSEAGSFTLEVRVTGPGERKLEIALTRGKTDIVVFNVMEPIKQLIETRVDYICRRLYQGDGAEVRHSFLPLSNQGESLGKLTLVLMKNIMGTFDQEQVRQVENSAVCYVLPKWFKEGNFSQPVKLYGDFYRIFDLDYIAHVFYLLSKFQPQQLAHQQPVEYLQWAADVMIVRLDEHLHADERESKETQLLGTYILFIEDLLRDLAQCGVADKHNRLNQLWQSAGNRMRRESAGYKGAVTEHFYDNAGFGPSCQALCILNYTNEAKLYGELLLANIGCSNDFRAQNPDRWWEALSYMIHSLWGGLVAAAALSAYEHLRENEYLLASYRATVAMFYCYDWHATATAKQLDRGQAASTYSVAGPNLNRPDLSRNRFGQSVFAQDGGLFQALFSNASGDDWDMGEELVAYLSGFGTKCFLYYRDGEVHCVNGEIVKQGDRYLVTSYAAYPREFYFFEENATYAAAQGEEARTIVFDSGRFYSSGNT
ncbi:hypothetical protein [Paenibacillus xerothermodurans]|uniref:Uncharacterized protein n=1 Tax=Paenibacillus xerothermodurans TaxID=1977292 RepID=A0A2W1NTI3_PAEXE|nr:hypothetical protein [Paenibacillus xerothermodurans]PZE22835.1 hypothetical protein CBW46_003510 [Paenibacillus xerothermodurans]